MQFSHFLKIIAVFQNSKNTENICLAISPDKDSLCIGSGSRLSPEEEKILDDLNVFYYELEETYYIYV